MIEETQPKSLDKVWMKLILVISLFFANAFCLAQDEAGGDEMIKMEPGPKERNLEKSFLESNIAISEWFDSAAEGLDLFLVGRRLTTRKNKTSFRIENTTFTVEGKKPLNTTGFNILLNLPNVEKYLHVKFTTYDEREDQRSVKNNYLRQTPRERNYGATVGLFRKLGNIRTSFEPRIELEDPLKISHSLTFESVADMKKYQINPKLEFFASPTKGTGMFQGLNFHFILTKRFNLTLINEAEYLEKTHLSTVTNGFSVGHYLTSRTSLAYTTLVVSTNRPLYHLDSYNFSVAWNETLYKKILDYQIIPNYEFARSRNFRGRLGLTLNVNLNF